MAAIKNPQWEDFAQAWVAGNSQRKAYRIAYPHTVKWKDETVDSKACNLAKKDKVKARYEELKQIAAMKAGGAVLTRNEKREILASMARDESLPPGDRQRAIDLDNKMEDEYTSNVNMTGNLNNPMAGLTTEELKKLIGDG